MLWASNGLKKPEEEDFILSITVILEDVILNLGSYG